MKPEVEIAAKQWLSSIKQLPELPVKANIFNTADLVENPANSMAVGDYQAAAAKAATPAKNPISIFEGMQTTVNLCRVRAGYDPIDLENNGTQTKFLEFTNNIAGVPFLTLEWAMQSDVMQQSHDANILIESFVNAFQGILEKDKKSISDSVKVLASAALSYSEQVERQSNFAQNLLQVSPGMVYFGLYSSMFAISVKEHKGVINYQSSYTLRQAQYSLSQERWERVCPLFEEEEKTSTEDWLAIFKTPKKQGSAVKTLCLE